MVGTLVGYYSSVKKEEGKPDRKKFILTISDDDHVSIQGDIFKNAVLYEDKQIDPKDFYKKKVCLDGSYFNGGFYVNKMFEVK